MLKITIVLICHILLYRRHCVYYNCVFSISYVIQRGRYLPSPSDFSYCDTRPSNFLGEKKGADVCLLAILVGVNACLMIFACYCRACALTLNVNPFLYFFYRCIDSWNTDGPSLSIYQKSMVISSVVLSTPCLITVGKSFSK